MVIFSFKFNFCICNYFIYYGFNQPIEQITGILDQFTQGRYSIFGPIVDLFGNMNIFENYLYGTNIYNLSILEIGHAPHNDVLSMLIDILIIFILFLFCISRDKIFHYLY